MWTRIYNKYYYSSTRLSRGDVARILISMRAPDRRSGPRRSSDVRKITINYAITALTRRRRFFREQTLGGAVNCCYIICPLRCSGGSPRRIYNNRSRPSPTVEPVPRPPSPAPRGRCNWTPSRIIDNCPACLFASAAASPTYRPTAWSRFITIMTTRARRFL